jgi:hypothetical protein
MALLAPRTLEAWCGEGHVIEWLTAHMLLIAFLMGLMAIVRLIQQRRPRTLTLFLTVGYLWGFWREIEWGEPFVGEKVIYSRFVFRPRAYFDPTRFDGLARDTGLTEQFLYKCFLIFFVLVVVIAVVLVVYLLRHRRLFLRELKVLHRQPWGWYFFAGCGMYLFAQLASEAVEDLQEAGLITMGINREVLNEPLELIASMLFVRSMAVMWHAQRCYLPVGVVRGRQNSVLALAAGPAHVGLWRRRLNKRKKTNAAADILENDSQT